MELDSKVTVTCYTNKSDQAATRGLPNCQGPRSTYFFWPLSRINNCTTRHFCLVEILSLQLKGYSLKDMKIYFSILLFLYFHNNTNGKKNYENDNGEKVKKGKKISFTKDGNIDVSVRYKKWSDPKQRTLCCPLAFKHCKAPCAGASCKYHVKMMGISVTCDCY